MGKDMRKNKLTKRKVVNPSPPFVARVVSVGREPFWYDINNDKIYLDEKLKQELPREKWEGWMMDAIPKKPPHGEDNGEDRGGDDGEEDERPILLSGGSVILNPPKDIVEIAKDII